MRCVKPCCHWLKGHMCFHMRHKATCNAATLATSLLSGKTTTTLVLNACTICCLFAVSVRPRLCVLKTSSMPCNMDWSEKLFVVTFEDCDVSPGANFSFSCWLLLSAGCHDVCRRMYQTHKQYRYTAMQWRQHFLRCAYNLSAQILFSATYSSLSLTVNVRCIIQTTKYGEK